MNISLHQLRVFVAVARQRSFTRAAREFDLTQSAVSRCVRELEDAIELRLFDRTTRQVELTTAGASLERRIGRLLDEIDITLREGRAAHESHTGVVVIASNPVLSSSWLPGGLARCAAAFPDLIISVKDVPQAAVLAGVEHGEVDFGVVSDFDPATHTGMHAQALFSTPLCAVLPEAHPLALRPTLAWSALDEVPLVTLNADAGSRASVDRALGALRSRARPIQELGHVAAVLRMIELGLGVGVLPVDAHWPAHPGRTVTRPLLPEVSLTTMLVRRKNRSLRPNAEAVWSQFFKEAHPQGLANGAGPIWPGVGARTLAAMPGNSSVLRTP
ncbi:LysR family transcriptional regulator [Paraburkholderia saeva]|uniref:HTH-type transcriptional regulator HdfR n=1 Tax=Paraburkholderia saeva TaxID=2777537 RepID=A0A9N8X1E9_9BURK|nr:LysR family transcriptional regulator [Paraburkholderia saeva]CAG4887184.1 HTH-type transcriptional regulator HdfR [Paraburkholderia saeva]CAG4894725.1 HTH-type transcriptional regulator HdfR [Paraburkholderia saeva]CAG4898509.1 HTH-type transcriptional regulator HdfR [Paraburkholderia saeva]